MHVLVKQATKWRIMQSSELSFEKINRVMHNYQQIKVIHSWLHMRKNRGEVLPTTLQQMQVRPKLCFFCVLEILLTHHKNMFPGRNANAPPSVGSSNARTADEGIEATVQDEKS